MEDMICPNGWTGCQECSHTEMCMAGLYRGERIVEVAKIVEKQIHREVVKTVEHIKRGTWADKFLKMSEDERWQDYRKHHIPDLHHKEPIPLDGPSSPGGGSKSNVKKAKKGTKPTIYKWGSIL